MKALININNMVCEVVEDDKIFPVHPDLKWLDCPDTCEKGWIWNGSNVVEPIEPPLSNDQLKFLYADALKTFLYSKAVEKDYSNEQSIVSYKDSTNATWKQEATDFIAWRDLCWQYALDILNQVEAQEIEPPSLADFIANAPVLNWN